MIVQIVEIDRDEWSMGSSGPSDEDARAEFDDAFLATVNDAQDSTHECSGGGEYIPREVIEYKTEVVR